MTTLTLSHSKLDLFMHSERCYWWRYIRRLEPKEKSKYLVWGSAVDAALTALYERGGVSEAIDAVRDTNKWQALERLAMTGGYHTTDRLISVLEQYANASLDDDTERYDTIDTQVDATRTITEIDDPNTNACPDDECEHISPPLTVEWRGIFDWVVRSREDGMIYVIDHKTTSKKTDSSYYADRFQHDNQMTAYTWLATQMYGEEFGGILINAIQTTKTIDCNPNRIVVSRDDWETMEFLTNTNALAPRIAHAQAIGEDLLAQGFTETNSEVLRHFPMRNTYAENFCDYADLNRVAPDARELIIESDYKPRKEV